MSAEATFWAWSQDVKSTLKLTLLALANCHNENTDRCDPSIIYISKTTGLDKKTVQKNLVDLENSGLIIRSSRTGTSTSYTLNIEHKPYPKTGIPKNGYTQKRVIPKTDLTLPKNGKGVYPKTGTKPKKKLKETKTYAFEGETIKLVAEDFARLKKLFKNLDLTTHLEQLDLELRGTKKWWPAMNAKLNYRNTAGGKNETSKSLSAIDRVRQATGQTGSAEDESESDGKVVASYG